MSKDIDKLMSAVKDGNLDKVKSMLDGGFFRRKVNVNAVDHEGRTALMEASWMDHVNIVKALLERGADVNATSNTGNTALMSASSYGRLGVMTVLLDRGAAVNAADNDGNTALMEVSESGYDTAVRLLCDLGANGWGGGAAPGGPREHREDAL